MRKLSGINVRKKEEGGLVCGWIENYSVERGWGCEEIVNENKYLLKKLNQFYL